MLERLYEFLNFLHNKVEKYPDEKHFTIEMEQDLFDFCRETDLIPANGIFKFEGKTFVLA